MHKSNILCGKAKLKAVSFKMDIRYFDRYQQKIVQEKVYGAEAIEWLYSSWFGKFFNRLAVAKITSKLYGVLQSVPWSRFKIEEFVQQFAINLPDFLPAPGRSHRHPYASFNQFFIRQWKPGVRQFITDIEKLPAFIEGRYLGYNKTPATIPVKKTVVDPKLLLGKSRWASRFVDGPMLIGRLAPVDYHRFHFPVDGQIVDSWRETGVLHSVNPVALRAYPRLFLENEREITIIKSEHFGYLAYVEVGAVCVGKIVQHQVWHKQKVKRGQEKGFFLFGGSTVILLGEAKKWQVAKDIEFNSNQQLETYVHLGDEVGVIK